MRSLSDPLIVDPITVDPLITDPITVFTSIRGAAELIVNLKSIFDGQGHLNEQLKEILATLKRLEKIVVTGINKIIVEIGGIEQQIDEDVALDNMNIAETGFYQHLIIFNDKQAAMADSFQGSNRLFRESNVAFTGAFMYVVNIRLAVLKEFDPYYYTNQQFRGEFNGYIEHLEEWISQLEELIEPLHTVHVRVIKIHDDDGTVLWRHYRGEHLRENKLVNYYNGPLDDLSGDARDYVKQQAENSRRDGIARDKHKLGVSDMENTVTAWRNAFVFENNSG